MSNWNEIIHQYFSDLLVRIQQVIDMLSPMAFMEPAWGVVQRLLPAPVDVSMVTTGLRVVFGYLAPYFLALDYFIDMTAFVAVIGWIALIEFGTFFYRAWRMVRSTLT